MVSVAAVGPVLALLAAVLGGCEYSTDTYAEDGDPEQSQPPAAASRPPTDAGRDLADSRDARHSPQDNIDALAELLGRPDGSGLPYASGGTASWTADIPAGEYFLTAVCVAAPGAELVVRLGTAAPERTSFRCGMGKVMYLDHKGGTISAEVVAPADAPYVVTGVRLDPDKAPRGPSFAQTTAWAAGELGPVQAGEFRGYPWEGQWHHSGAPAVAGMLTFTFVCDGPVMVEVTVLQPRGTDLFQGSIPCGTPFPADFPVGPEGVMVMMDSNNYPVQAAYSLVPAAGGRQ
jgi:hypothetical protein